MSKVNEVKYILLKIFYSIAMALYRKFIAIKKYTSLHSLHSFIMNNIQFHKFKSHFQTGIISMILWSIFSTCSESRIITHHFFTFQHIRQTSVMHLFFDQKYRHYY